MIIINESNNYIALIVSILVMILVIIFDQLGPWPVTAFYLGAIILYPLFILKYIIAFIIGMTIFYYIIRQNNGEMDFFLLIDFTFLSLIITWPFLVIVVYFASYASILSIMLTTFFSLLIAFYPFGLVAGLRFGFRERSPKEMRMEWKKLAVEALINSILAIIIPIIGLSF